MNLFKNSMILLVLCLIGSGICDQKVSEPKVRSDSKFVECDGASQAKVTKDIACPAGLYILIFTGGLSTSEVCCVVMDLAYSNRNALKKYCKTKPGFDEEFNKNMTVLHKQCKDEKPSKSVCQTLINKHSTSVPECESHSYSKGHSLSVGSLSLILSFIISLILMF